MRLINIKLLFTAIYLMIYASIASANLLPAGVIKTTASYSFNSSSGRKLSAIDLPTMRELLFKEQLPKVTISTGVFDKLQLDFSFNNFNMHLFNEMKNDINKVRIFIEVGTLGFTSSLFSSGNYNTSTKIAAHVNLSPSGKVNYGKDSKFEKIEGSGLLLNAITLNNAHSYKFNNDIRLIALHKNFINIKFDGIKYRIKVIAPVTICLPILENLNVNLSTVLCSWDNGEKNEYENNFKSIWNKIPTILGINYGINDSFSINSSIKIVNYIGNLSKTINSLGFSIGLSCRSNMA